MTPKENAMATDDDENDGVQIDTALLSDHIDDAAVRAAFAAGKASTKAMHALRAERPDASVETMDACAAMFAHALGASMYQEFGATLAMPLLLAALNTCRAIAMVERDQLKQAPPGVKH